MNNFNLIVIEGRLTHDAEYRKTSKGTSMLKFSLANNFTKKENGKNVQGVTYFRVVAWDKLADIMSKYLKKGTPVIVSGRIKIGKYTAKDGNEKTSIEIIANNIEFTSHRVAHENEKAKKNFDSKISA